jgi:hypothetical protein
LNTLRFAPADEGGANSTDYRKPRIGRDHVRL